MSNLIPTLSIKEKKKVMEGEKKKSLEDSKAMTLVLQG